jgi:hypothetical protein
MPPSLAPCVVHGLGRLCAWWFSSTYSRSLSSFVEGLGTFKTYDLWCPCEYTAFSFLVVAILAGQALLEFLNWIEGNAMRKRNANQDHQIGHILSQCDICMHVMILEVDVLATDIGIIQPYDGCGKGQLRGSK